MKIPGFNICIDINVNPGMPAADLKPAARQLLKAKLPKPPVGKKDLPPVAYIGPWESSTPTQDDFSVNEDPYPAKTTSKYDRVPRGLKEKPKPGYYH